MSDVKVQARVHNKNIKILSVRHSPLIFLLCTLGTSYLVI